MILVGKFTEAQCAAKEDKLACERITKETGGSVKYFFPKFKKRKGAMIMEVYGMTTEEYCNSNVI